MKKYQKAFAPILVLGVVVLAGALLYFISKNFGVKNLNLTVNSSPTPISSIKPSTNDNADPDLLNFIKTEFKLSDQATIEVKAVEGVYAWGNAGEPDGGGYYWAAAKVNDKWNYSMSGNGIPDCTQVSIFPVGLFGGKFDDCYEESNLISR